MKISVKKTYCNGCQRLVRGIEKEQDGNICILCPRCEAMIWTWDGERWKHGVKVA
ncbi:MAG: hypothetical protein Q8O16_03360 [Dehalococcoidia bacterium]|nr:hypothetical protein [Dehalococcoidia bacterium]